MSELNNLVVVSLDDRLANAGDTLPLCGKLELKTFEFGDRSFELPEGASYDLVLTNAGEGILVTGILRAHLVGTCDRCLDDAHLDVAGEVEEYFLFHEPDSGVMEEDEEEGPDYSLVSPDSTIDLTEAIASALIMEIPFVVLCREDCAGLCPICGENLNHTDCGHAKQIEQEEEQKRLENNPFSVLKDLNLDK
ncbi:MAG: DUF177 domain-containing protein [Coriobacteriales bacterium]|nr:DUF177 domain-containing protein [Coriobacteriales bacterium]